MITQQVIKPTKKAASKPTKATLAIRLRKYFLSFITRSNPVIESERKAKKWSPQLCRAHSLQEAAELPEDLRRSLFGLPPRGEKQNIKSEWKAVACS